MQYKYVLNSISFRCAFCDEKNEIKENVDKLINKEVKCQKCGRFYKVPFDYVYTFHNKNLICTGDKKMSEEDIRTMITPKGTKYFVNRNYILTMFSSIIFTIGKLGNKLCY